MDCGCVPRDYLTSGPFAALRYCWLQVEMEKGYGPGVPSSGVGSPCGSFGSCGTTQSSPLYSKSSVEASPMAAWIWAGNVTPAGSAHERISRSSPATTQL